MILRFGAALIDYHMQRTLNDYCLIRFRNTFQFFCCVETTLFDCVVQVMNKYT